MLAAIDTPTCTCTPMVYCPEAERLSATMSACEVGSPERRAANLSLVEHRAPFNPDLAKLLERLRSSE